MRFAIPVLLAAGALAEAQEPIELRATGGPESLVLSGGRVWTDGGFVERPLYVEDGRFVQAPPTGESRVVGLGGRWVVPPYADAHVHHFTTEASAASSRELFLSRGFFYVANLCGPHGAREATAAYTNRPSGVDVLFAHGALTGLTSHPVPLYRMLHERRGRPGATFMAENDDNTFYRIDSSETLKRKLELLFGTGPDLVKLMQSRIRLRESGSTDSLDPDLVPSIVERAHAAGVPVVAHIDDAADFAYVVAAGVDWVAHTPGFGRRADEPLEEFLLTAEDAQRAAKAGVVVISTAGAYDAAREDNSAAQEAVDRNLVTLRAAGVTVVFGSDDWMGPETELRALLTHAGYAPVELLRMLCETTPCTLFPGRAIGSLAAGHEGSLLVLAGNPLDDPAHLGEIDLIVKQGVVLAERRGERASR